MTITERLRAELVRSKIGLAELAVVTGIDRSNLNKFATGKIGMNLENGVVLATVLGVDLTGEGRREVTYVGQHVIEEVDKALRDIPSAVAPEGRPSMDVLVMDDPSPEETTPEQRRSVEVVARGKPKPPVVRPLREDDVRKGVEQGPSRLPTPSPVSDSRKAQFEQQRLKKLRGKGG